MSKETDSDADGSSSSGSRVNGTENESNKERPSLLQRGKRASSRLLSRLRRNKKAEALNNSSSHDSASSGFDSASTGSSGEVEGTM